MTKKATINQNLDKKRKAAEQMLARMKHSSVPLHKAIVDVLTQLPLSQSDGAINVTNVKVAWHYKQIVDDLAESSRRWAISKHYIYDMCLPRIVDVNNPEYSPVYQRYAGDLPGDQFGELEQEIFLKTDSKNTTGKLVKRRERLTGDSRLQNISNFGSAWNSTGELVKRDQEGKPVLDGYAGVQAKHIEKIVHDELRHTHRDRHIQAFMIAHTRDREEVGWTSEPRLKESHIHAVIALSAQKSRYQMMKLMGYNFDDITETFSWIKGHSSSAKNMSQRAEAFLSTLSGAIKNYTVPVDYGASLRYLVHQSKAAVHDPRKATYSSTEVISWLPDDEGRTYDSIADVYDNEAVADNSKSQVLYHLEHSAYCRAHHILEKYVGDHLGEKALTVSQVVAFRRLGKKEPRKFIFTKKSKQLILNTLILWIRSKKIEFSDSQMLIHAAFDDNDADALLSDKDFVDRLTRILQTEEQAIMSDPAAVRSMTTYCVFAAQGGIGKTRLANTMALLMDKYRKPFQVVTRNRQITFDPFQNYESETSVIMDELSPASFGWSQLKDLLDPYKIPYIGSRFHNKSPWNLKHTFITNVFEHGISDYVTGVLRYAEGVSSLGYLRKDDGDWNLVTGDIEAGKHYVSQLSQILRRLPFVITLAPTANGAGTSIKVSIINFKPSGLHVDHYDYVHTKDSVHVFRTVINDDLSEAAMEKIAKKVIAMISKLKSQTKLAFQQHPGQLLDEIEGFIPDHCNFLVQYNGNHDPVLETVSTALVHTMFGNNEIAAPSQNLITILGRTKLFLWPGTDKDKAHVEPSLNQLDALLKGYEVPIEKVGFDEIKTVRLTPEAMKLVNAGQTAAIWKELNKASTSNATSISSQYFAIQTNENIAAFKVEQ
ncbi:hypothetical protein [Limosilactobacillus agrestimuris]|uniref:hypothetical protein n=1 Tax=Limosilactobacillus agrestimuris TaxID=2941331 RepID=UPI00203FB651|nr:hypothetical protein [Limosilactobacillus agrestimuris]